MHVFPSSQCKKLKKGADKVTLLLLQEPKNARREKDNNQEFEKRVPESQDKQKLEIFTEFFHLYSVFLVS